MKLIIAIIRPERLEAVQDELQLVLDEGDHYRLTVDSVEGHGRQEGEIEIFRGAQVRQNLVPKTRIMLCVNDFYVPKAVDAIVKAARTEGEGAIGDGKIFILPLEDAVRIRTGERGKEAI
jgi:nitrogen regulatory protein P-II 1